MPAGDPGLHRCGLAGVRSHAALPAGRGDPDDTDDPVPALRRPSRRRMRRTPRSSRTRAPPATAAHTAAGPEPARAAGARRRRCASPATTASGSDLDVAGQYTDPAVPANDPATRSTTTATTRLATRGRPRTRWHRSTSSVASPTATAECTDCHNTHIATLDVVGPDDDRLDGVRSPDVDLGRGGDATAPQAPRRRIRFLDGTAGSQPTREYEICLKCHSGFTTLLPSNAGQPPSRHALDKGVEFNPSNASYHPVEAAGTNTTAGDGEQPGRHVTVQAVELHDRQHGPLRQLPRRPAKRTTRRRPPPAGADLAPHTSQYRGILLQNYRDRVLKPAHEPYAAADFALCYVCHAEEPFLSSTYATPTSLDHAKHSAELAGKGNSRARHRHAGRRTGQRAVLRVPLPDPLHGARGGRRPGSNPRLVNFAPNVGDRRRRVHAQGHRRPAAAARSSATARTTTARPTEPPGRPPGSDVPRAPGARLMPS